MRTQILLIGGLGLWVLSAPIARAQAPAPEPAPTATDAREHFKRGEAAYQKGSYDLAISEWQAAYSADPRPRIQYNLFQAYERLGQLGQAAEALQRYLSTADPDDPSYADATARMTALQQRLQATGVRLVGGVEGASINVSGHDWGRLPRPDRIPVQPGNHRVVVALDGYKEFTANVVVPAGQVVDVMVQLDRDQSQPGPPADPAIGTATPPPELGDHPAEASGSGNTAFFIAAGVLGAGAIGSGIWAINRVSELDGCDDPANFCSEEDAVETQRNIAFGLTAVLGVGAIASLVYGLVSGGDDKEEAALTCRPDPLGGRCQLRF